MNLILWSKFRFINELVFRAIHPIGNYYEKPKYLGQIIYVLSIMREAARAMKDDLDALRDELQNHKQHCIHCYHEPHDTKAKIKLREMLHLLTHFIPVTQDYGLSMKNDVFKTTRRLHAKMVLMFANFQHREYIRNTLCFDMTLRGLEKENGNTWNFVKTSSNWFNEEGGETLNSMFATKMNRDPLRGNLSHANDKYVVVKKMWEVTRKYEKGLGLAHLTTRKDDFKEESNDVKSAMNVFRNYMEEQKRVWNDEKEDSSLRTAMCFKCEAAEELKDEWKMCNDLSMRKDRTMDMLKCGEDLTFRSVDDAENVYERKYREHFEGKCDNVEDRTENNEDNESQDADMENQIDENNIEDVVQVTLISSLFAF
jgi:hypothetical protein